MQLSNELKEAIDNNAFCAISTHLNDDEIQTHLMWIDYEDDYLIINTEKERKKTENIRSNSNISLVVFHPTAMYSSWEIRGVVVEILSDQSADSHIDKLSLRYTGKPYRENLVRNGIMKKLKVENYGELNQKK
jgi:general stress protein 26